MTAPSLTKSALRIRKAAVLGAGVMGAQIAAHLTNADVETVLFDLPAKEGPKSGIALKAIENLKKLSPAPLADGNRAAAIIPAMANHSPESNATSVPLCVPQPTARSWAD